MSDTLKIIEDFLTDKENKNIIIMTMKMIIIKFLLVVYLRSCFGRRLSFWSSQDLLVLMKVVKLAVH